jgi:hypothetical protein
MIYKTVSEVNIQALPFAWAWTTPFCVRRKRCNLEGMTAKISDRVPRITEILKFYRNHRIFTEITLDITEIPIRSSDLSTSEQVVRSLR